MDPQSLRTTRPDSIRPEAWLRLCKRQKDQAIADWAKEHAKLQETPTTGNLGSSYRRYSIPQGDCRLLVRKLGTDSAPSMPCVQSVGRCEATRCNSCGGKLRAIRCGQNKSVAKKEKRTQMDHLSGKGYVGSYHYGVVRKPSSSQGAVKIREPKGSG